MEKYALIVAGGIGNRMKSKVPKQFLLHAGTPVIIKTIRKFMEVDPDIQIVVVLPKKHLSHWVTLEKDYPFISNIITTIGGKSRTCSVRSGLDKIEGDGLVAIHDSVRPFVKPDLIIRSYQYAELYGSGVTAVPLKDSIREMIEGNKSKARNRDRFVLVQTPQTFRVNEIKAAYNTVGDKSFTDDANLFEATGKDVYIVEGNHSNIKITTPEDLECWNE